MTLRFAAGLLILATIPAAGCDKSDQPAQLPAAPAIAPTEVGTPDGNSGAPASAKDSGLIRQAIEDHVRDDRSINMSALDMTVESMSVTGDQAQASATFRAKQGGPSMAMSYSLERRGNGWVVAHSQPGGGQFTHPPMDQAHSANPPNPAVTPPVAAAPDVTDFLKNRSAPNSN